MRGIDSWLERQAVHPAGQARWRPGQPTWCAAASLTRKRHESFVNHTLRTQVVCFRIQVLFYGGVLWEQLQRCSVVTAVLVLICVCSYQMAIRLFIQFRCVCVCCFIGVSPFWTITASVRPQT